MASRNGHKDVLLALISAGADPKLRNEVRNRIDIAAAAAAVTASAVGGLCRDISVRVPPSDACITFMIDTIRYDMIN